MGKLTIDIDADKLFHDFEIEMQKRYGVSGCRLMELAEADKDGRCLILNKKFALTPKGKNPVWILRDNGIVKDFIVDAWLYFGRDGNLYCVYSTTELILWKLQLEILCSFPRKPLKRL